jgi:hypothetical protein
LEKVIIKSNCDSLTRKNPDKINWKWLSGNPNAIHLLEQNLNKIHWGLLSENPNAIHLLQQNPDKNCRYSLSHNPSIFEYDYEAMKERMRPMAEELMANRFHPKNFDKWVGWGFDECQECEF